MPLLSGCDELVSVAFLGEHGGRFLFAFSNKAVTKLGCDTPRARRYTLALTVSHKGCRACNP